MKSKLEVEVDKLEKKIIKIGSEYNPKFSEYASEFIKKELSGIRRTVQRMAKANAISG